MADSLSMVDRIRANAQLVVTWARENLDTEVGFDEAGVRWLDGYIQHQHEQGNPANREGLVNRLGSYLGASSRATEGLGPRSMGHGACGSTNGMPRGPLPRSESSWSTGPRTPS